MRSGLLMPVTRHIPGCFRIPPKRPSSPGAVEFVEEFSRGDLTGVACPQCLDAEVVYNGNYFCRDVWICGWAMQGDEEVCRACDELFNVCYVGLMWTRSGRDPRQRWIGARS